MQAARALRPDLTLKKRKGAELGRLESECGISCGCLG